MTARVVIFAHYDQDDIIDDYVVYYLQELKKVADIVFVSDSALPECELSKIENLVIKAIAEPHGEYDFGSYKVGFNYLQPKLSEYDELILVNDSCYGPFWPLQDVWDKMDSQKCDFWGLFEHFCPGEKRWYVQSYFIVLKKQIFTSDIFREFIQSVKKLKDKRRIVAVYEVGLTRLLHDNSFVSASLCPTSRDNQSHTYHILKLINKHHYPLIKRALLTINPCRARRVGFIYDTIKTKLGEQYNFGLIEAHLERVDPQHRANWYFPLGDQSKKIAIGKVPIIRYKIRNKKHFVFFSLKLFGLTIFKTPILLAGKPPKHLRHK